MKKRLLLIGGGTIAMHYREGLEHSPHYALAALVDTNERCPARSIFSVPFFTNLSDALALGMDVALISTPTNTHDAIARELLKRGVAVVTEKPMCERYDKVASLCALAKKEAVDLGCLFHWKYADEVRFLKERRDWLGTIERISVCVCDDYAATPDGSIRPDRRGLCGAWLDSGINILSYLGELCDLSDWELLFQEHILDTASGMEKYAHRRYRFGKTIADITVDWRTESREKTSEILCKRGVIFINHTEQAVLLDGAKLYQSDVPDRLTSHYRNAFASFSLRGEDLHRTGLLHKILFVGS